MIRSLYAGISGLQGHQSRMDVIGNNIANVNTIGFKSGRMTFMDAMSQTLSYGKSTVGTSGGANPMQVGLGMKIGSVDTNFSQGILQTTNMTTDLALEGEGFFVVNDGSQNLYTRAGAFQIDEHGNLLAQGGKYFVQGKTADATGEIPTGGSVGNIQIPFGQKSPAKATTEIKYHCNLDASANAEANVWAGDWGKAAEATGGTTASMASVVAGNNFTIAIDGGTAETVTIPSGVVAAPANVSELVTALNQGIRENSNLANKVEAVANSAGDGVIFQTTDKGGTNTTITVAGGTVDLSAAGLNITSLTGSGTQGTTALADLPIITSALTVGDTITISGTNPDGSEVNATYTYAAGDTVNTFLNSINGAFTGATATVDDKGRILLTDAVKGKTQSTVSLSFTDVDSNGSAMSIPSFSIDEKGVNAGTHTASIYAYDSLGKKHTVEITFTKNQGADNRWDWEAKVDGGDTVPTGGNSGYVTFNNDGSIATMQSSDSGKLTFEAGGGANTMEVNLFGGDSGSFAGITQYNSPFTTIAYEQDGYTMGKINNVYFDENGIVYGEYSNGQSQKLAQVSLAKFVNENGLIKGGNNFYKASANSGNAEIGLAGINVNAAVRSGYLEGSNVDLSKELTDMIITQRGYQANTKTITTSDAMLQELIMRVKR